MESRTIIILLISLAGCIAMISSVWKDIIDRRRKWYRMVKPKGWVIIGCAILLLVLPLVQKHFEDIDVKNTKIESKKEQDTRDSIQRAEYAASVLQMKKEYDSGNINQTIAITSTLGTYGLALDAANNRLYKIVKDSSKTRVEATVLPTFKLSKFATGLFRQANLEYMFSMGFISHDAPSTGFELIAHIIVEDSATKKLLYTGKIDFLSSREVVPSNQEQVSWYTFSHPPSVSISKVYIYIKGEYYDNQRTRKLLIDEVNVFTSSTKDFGTVMGKWQEPIMAVIPK